MNKPDERIEYERDTLKYWTRIYQRSPEAAFEAVTLKLLDLEWELINLQRRLDRWRQLIPIA